MTQAEYLRHLRDEAKREGRCSICRARPAGPGVRVTCGDCRERTRGRKRQNVADGLCACGLARRAGRASCFRCAKRVAVGKQKRVDWAKAQGLCVRGACWLPAAPGRVMCHTHLAEGVARRRREYARDKAAGVCTHSGCHEPQCEDNLLCPAHRDAMRVYHRELRRRAR